MQTWQHMYCLRLEPSKLPDIHVCPRFVFKGFWNDFFPENQWYGRWCFWLFIIINFLVHTRMFRCAGTTVDRNIELETELDKLNALSMYMSNFYYCCYSLLLVLFSIWFNSFFFFHYNLILWWWEYMWGCIENVYLTFLGLWHIEYVIC